ncbi:very short patch repair endonuclease [Muribaculum intestinale]|uniref:very short patch repair endonuclease n=1 Tax=Muribaculum intestinale TaxID=1796646 RepID=UPI0025A9B899|nr:very short patch repair endonuclease [Muribaculum intestinale]
MTDIKTPEQRSRNMAAIRSSDTKPEMLVRRYLHSMGWRYGLHNKKLPGSPDIVMRRFKTVIFVNGCFWHGHENCKYYRLPKSNTGFWQAKIDKNRARDARDIESLNKLGWRVIIVWECQLKTDERRMQTFRELFDIFKDPYSHLRCHFSEAAEPEFPYGKNI